MLCAERVAARQAPVVVEDVVIDDRTYSRARCRSGCAAEEAGNHGTCYSAKDRADRSSDRTDRCPGLRARQRHRYATGCARHTADRAACFAANI